MKFAVFPKSSLFLYGLAVVLLCYISIHRLIMGDFPPAQPTLSIVLAAMVCMIVASAIVVYGFLTTKGKRSQSQFEFGDTDTSDRILQGALQTQVASITDKLNDIVKAVEGLTKKDSEPLSLKEALGETEKSKIASAIREQLASGLSAEFFKGLQSEAANAIEKSAFSVVLDSQFQNAKVRLNREIISQLGRANLNLVVGGAMSLFAVGLVVVVFLGSYGPSGSPHAYTIGELTATLAPRGALVVFIEIISFFFLRLYKAGLDDMKFYQNELTNLESWYLAVTLARQCEDDEPLAKVIEALVHIERNFVIKKGERTLTDGTIKPSSPVTQALAEIARAASGRAKSS